MSLCLTKKCNSFKKLKNPKTCFFPCMSKLLCLTSSKCLTQFQLDRIRTKIYKEVVPSQCPKKVRTGSAQWQCYLQCPGKSKQHFSHAQQGHLADPNSTDHYTNSHLFVQVKIKYSEDLQTPVNTNFTTHYMRCLTWMYNVQTKHFWTGYAGKYKAVQHNTENNISYSINSVPML